MSSAKLNGLLAEYRSVATDGSVEDADAHQLIALLMDGALRGVSAAGFALRSGMVAEKCRQIRFATSVIEGLRDSLDADRGGEIAVNLDALYQYMCKRLCEANLENDEAALKEVYGLMREIKGAWDGIATQVREKREPVAASLRALG